MAERGVNVDHVTLNRSFSSLLRKDCQAVGYVATRDDGFRYVPSSYQMVL